MARLRCDFLAMDRDLDGVISANDLALALGPGAEGAHQLELEALFSAVDLNGDGEITYSEFISVATQGKTRLRAEDECAELDKFDTLSHSSSEIQAIAQSGEALVESATKA